jgi:hypothetical protein
MLVPSAMTVNADVRADTVGQPAAVFAWSAAEPPVATPTAISSAASRAFGMALSPESRPERPGSVMTVVVDTGTTAGPSGMADLAVSGSAPLPAAASAGMTIPSVAGPADLGIPVAGRMGVGMTAGPE